MYSKIKSYEFKILKKFIKELCLVCFPITLSLQPDGVNRWYFKLKLFDLTEYRNIWGLQHRWVTKIKGLENQSLWQRLNPSINQLSFCHILRFSNPDFWNPVSSRLLISQTMNFVGSISLKVWNIKSLHHQIVKI